MKMVCFGVLLEWIQVPGIMKWSIMHRKNNGKISLCEDKSWTDSIAQKKKQKKKKKISMRTVSSRQDLSYFKIDG